jgi:chromate transporter
MHATPEERNAEDPSSVPGAARDAPEPSPPRISLAALFARFLRFGLLAWGGPIAQVAMLEKELVEEERWVSVERFRRALAVYQALPGPEAHELCVWFGMLARGRRGAIVAGLGFMSPGLVLMLALAWLYVHVGLAHSAWAPALLGMQAGVLALIVRGAHRLALHAFARPQWCAIGAVALAAGLLGVPFWIVLLGAALAGPPAAEGRLAAVAVVVSLAVAGATAWLLLADGATSAIESAPEGHGAPPTVLALFALGLEAGLLTFGGAYTAIPFVRQDAVLRGGWLSDAQFLDGLGLGGVLPAPLVIFTAFVGFLGAGLGGGLAITAGLFLPAFGFTLLGHEFFERLTRAPRLRNALDAVTAAVVGLIAATALGLLRVTLTRWAAAAIFAGALVLLYAWRSRLAMPTAVLLGAAAGAALLG